MKSLENSAVPVPKTVSFCSDVSLLGTPFFIYKYTEGEFYSNTQLPKCQPEDRGCIYQSMIETLAKLHSVDIQDRDLISFGTIYSHPSKCPEKIDVAPYVIRQIKTWSKQYRSSETERIEDMEYLINELAGSFPHSLGEMITCLVHGDFKMDNMIFHPAPVNEVAAVLDWELVRVCVVSQIHLVQ